MKSYFFTLLFIISFFTNFFAQEPDFKKIKLAPPISNTDSLIKVGVSLHESKKYEEAITTYELINENDSNYVVAQYEIILSNMALQKDAEAIVICDHVLATDKSYYSKIILLKGNCYDNLKQYDKSKAMYLQGINEFPYSARFYHEYAVSCFNQKKYKEAQDNYINALKINPQYSPSHFQLGLLALKQKKIIPAMLSFQYYLLLDNSSNRAKMVIDLIEKIGDDAVKYEDFGTIDPIDQNNDFSDLESIVKSKAAYGEKFKSKVKLNFRMLKQIQVVLDKIEYTSEDAGFYNQFYAKFFKDMSSKGFTETYLYTILSGMNLEDANKWLKSNKQDVDKLKNWYEEYMKPYNELALKENTSDLKSYKLYLNNEIIAIGGLSNKNERTGYWKFLHKGTSILKSEGVFNAMGKNGPWKYYYEDGSIKEVCTFKNDKLDGEYLKYHNNGKITERLLYNEGKYDGLQTVYYANGNLKNVYNYKSDIQEGEESGYYKNGKLNYKVNVKQGKYDGIYNLYYENGSLQKTVPISNGIRIGIAKEFYNHPKEQLYCEGNNENDFSTGEWKYYFDDGKLSLVGTLNKKGLKEGIWKDYSKTGIVLEENTYSNDKSEGVSKNFYNDGKIYEEFYYRKNKINQYKYYNKNGELVKEILKQKNEFNFELYNRNGTVRSTGKLNGEQVDGQLNTFNYLGLKTESSEYKDDKKINTERTYYSNGQVAAETPYTNSSQEGLFTKYFANGNVVIKGYYQNNAEQGYWFYYDKNGPLSEIRYYVNGVQSGWQRDFACNGLLTRAERIDNGRIVERCYYDTLGKILTRINYDSCNNCDVVIPNIDGKPWIKRKLKNNFINGLSTTLYPNGNPYFESTYDMDLETGVSKSFDIFGKLQRETNYDADVKQGKLNTYKNTKLQYSANYNNGKLTGEVSDYYDNGKPLQVATYEYNNLEGPLTLYDDNGNVAIVLNYENDNLVSYTYEDESGKLLPVISINNPNMEVNAFYKNKKPSVKFAIKNGEKEGAFILNSINGNKLIEENYTFGFLNGVRTTYFPTGKVKTKSTIFFGDYNGLDIEYNENGTLQKEQNYMNGSRHGISKFYDTNGKLLLKSFFYNDYSIKFIP